MVFRFGLKDLKIVLNDVGEILFWSSFAFIAPIFFVLWYKEGSYALFSFLFIGLMVFFIGGLLKKIFSTEADTELKHAFLTVSLVWLLFSFFAALPFVLVQGSSLIDGVFETMSAATTTCLSVIDAELDSMPKSLIFWRNFLGWIGGLGIIVLALMGIVSAYSTSSKLFSAEGRDDTIEPNLKHTVKELWKIYIGIRALGVILLLLAGMNFFDALNYSISTVSTAGFNTSYDRLALQPNFLVEIILTFLLVLGGTNFSLHYFFVKKKSLKPYLQSGEFKAMVIFSILGGLLVTPKIIQFAPTMFDSLRISFFHAFSAQLGGHMAVQANFFALLDDFSKLVFVALMFIGGSSGSTSGGIKVSRFLLLLKQVYWKIKEIAFPKNTFFAKKFEGVEIDPKRLSEVNYFVVIYIGLLLLGTLVLTVQGFSLSDSLLEVSSAQGNAGLSVGIAEKGMPLASEVTLIFLMWAGRLDIIPLFAFIGLILSIRRK